MSHPSPHGNAPRFDRGQNGEPGPARDERSERARFEAEVLPHLDALWAMAIRLTRDGREAEDLVQDTVVKAFRFFHRFEEGSNVKAWLFRILVNTFYNTRRKERNVLRLHSEAEQERRIGDSLSAATTEGLHAEQSLLDRLAAEEIRAAVEKLPEEFRTAVLLCDVHEFSYKEIAEILGCPVGTVMSRLYRGRRLLQQALYAYAVEQGVLRPPRTESGEPADLEAYRRQKGRT